jgi:hypothetical protein
MVITSSHYLAKARAVLGNPSMSERELGELLGGYSQSMIAKAKAGNMSDPLALRIAEVIGADPGEVLTVARAEREKDPRVKAALLVYASKTLAALPSITAQAERGGMAAMVDQLTARPRRRAAAAAAVLAFGLVAGGAPAPAEAAPAAGNCSALCIMSTRPRRQAANEDSFTDAA